MRLPVSFLLIISFAVTALAQERITIGGSINGKLPPLSRDTLIQKNRDPEKNTLPYNGMPNVITSKPLPPVLIGNNGKGFDVYESSIDNMAILKPDTSFVSNMPVAIARPNNGNAKNSMPSFTIPGNKFTEFMEKQKKRDSLFMKRVPPKTYPYPKK